MFLAIINDTYAEVKAEIASQKNEFEIADYFKKVCIRSFFKYELSLYIRRKKKVIDAAVTENFRHALFFLS